MKYVAEFPELLEEWDYGRNKGKFDPHNVSVGSSRKKVNWVCRTCREPWEATPYNRHHLGRGCPNCSNIRRSKKLRALKLRKGENDLASQRPDLLLEWDYAKNDGLYSPDEMCLGDIRKVHWICPMGHPWTASVHNRTNRGSGCPECSKKVIADKARERLFVPDGSLVMLFPEIASEWHPTKNEGYDLQKTMPGSNDKVWWLCSECGKDYETQVCNRTGYKHVGCPNCNRYMHTSFAEQAVFYYLKQLFPDAVNRFTDIFDNQMELDIFIPELNLGIEYDGAYWHNKTTVNRSRKKYAVCREKQITLLRIKERDNRYTPCYDDCDYTIWRDGMSDEMLQKGIEEILQLLHCKGMLKVDISKDVGKIKTTYMVSYKERSLATKYPQLCAELHPTLNSGLYPELLLPSEHRKVWWLCPVCKQAYEASPSHRTREKPTSCPVCAGKKIVPGINDLATRWPELAAEWHPDLNGYLLPTTVPLNYSKKVWWKCANCENPYYITPNKRVQRNQGCSKCGYRLLGRE